jgi:hypothetical protein
MVKAVYALKGARSISDFARSAVLRSAGVVEPGDGQIQAHLSSLGQKVAELESRVTGLIQLLHDGGSS